MFLNYLYQEKQAEKIYFKGGTCLRLLYNSPRFSEDLDFSTPLSIKQIKSLLPQIIDKLKKEIAPLSMLLVWTGKNSLRYQLKYQGDEFKYPLNIRLDFTLDHPQLDLNVGTLISQIPISFSPLIVYLKEEEILAEKIRAFLMRAKGRDIFDFWYLLNKRVQTDQKLITKKLSQVNLIFKPELLKRKIQNYSDKKLSLELAKFLPASWRKIIPLLKEKISAYDYWPQINR